jgi:TBC1 domain family member 20
MTLSRKDQVSRLSEGGDEGMIHSVLTGLPEFSDYCKDQNHDRGYGVQPHPEPATIAVEPSNPNDTSFPKGVDDAPLTCKPSESQCSTSEADLHLNAPLPSPTLGSSLSPSARTVSDSPAHSVPLGDDDTGFPAVSGDNSVPRAVPQLVSTPASALDPSDIPLPPSAASTRTTSPTRAESHHSPPLYSLLSVFILADVLFTRFPPNTPELRLTRTLGPKSAMQKWAQDAALLPSDDQAEAFVVAADDIVVREALVPDSKELRQTEKKIGARKAKRGEAKLLITGAVLVLGVAVAFGVHARRGGGIGKGRETDWRALIGAFGALGERVMGFFDDAQLWL